MVYFPRFDLTVPRQVKADSIHRDGLECHEDFDLFSNELLSFFII